MAMGSLFPAGAELRGMSAEEFDALVDQARSGVERMNRLTAPRLLQAQHFARWDAGLLSGRSELVIEPSETLEDLWKRTVDAAVASGLVGPGESVVLTGGTHLNTPGATNHILVHVVRD